MSNLNQSSQTELADLLKARFPWLGTDEEADGSDTVEALGDLYEQLKGGK